MKFLFIIENVKGDLFMYDMFLRVTLAGILAGIIGFEREMRSKDAGLRTHFLVGIGSALMMIVSKYGFYDVLATKGFALDPSRIAAQVVCGIGFLGAGTIILKKNNIVGLTTAAGIWATAGIGIAIGAGMYSIGIFSTVLVFIGLEILDRMFKNVLNRYSDINIWTKSEKLTDIEQLITNNSFAVMELKTKRVNYEDINDVMLIKVKIRESYKNNADTLVNKLYSNKDVIKIEIYKNTI